MSLKRKITGFLFIFALTFFVFIFAPINNVNAEEMGEKGLSIDSETGVITSMVIGEISGDVVIPDEICGIPVTGIKDGVFSCCDDITSITIPDSVTSIGNQTFAECNNLVSVKLPSNLKTIGYKTFYMCPKLESITIPDSVTSIGGNAFAFCSSLKDVKLSENLTSIGSFAFWKCESLININLPSTLNSLKDGVFEECISLNSIDLSNIISIGKESFYGCSNLEHFTLSEGLTDIGNDAFMGCVNLSDFVMPNSVEHIGDTAFASCGKIKNINISENVKSIGNEAFSWCTSLENITVSENNNFYSSKDGVLFNKDKTTLIQYPIGNERTEYTVLDSVTNIDNKAFFSSNNLQKLKVSDKVTNIGNEVFFGSNKLRIYGYEGSYIQTYAEQEYLNFSILNENYKIYSENIEGGSVLYDEQNGSIVDCDTYVTKAIIPDTINRTKITSIGPDAFFLCKKLEYIELPETITKLEESAFNYCSNLKSIDIPNSIKSIESFCFRNCKKLNDVVIPDSVESFGENVFYSCDTLTSVKFPNTLTSIKEGTFSFCFNLQDVVIPESVTSIDDYAFVSCTSLSNIKLPNNLKNIGTKAFANCTNLKTLTVPRNVSSIGADIFYNCNDITLNVYGGSVGLSYAKANSIKYNVLDAVNISDKNVTVTFDKENYEYTSAQIRPIIEVKYNDIKLTENVDYLVSYGENINAGLGSVTIKGIDGYSGEITKQFNIVKKSIIEDNVILEKDTYEYTSNEIRPNVTVKVDEKTLTENKDYTISYSDNIMPGEGKITVTGIGNYGGEIVKTFNIEKINLKDENVTIENDSYLYTSNEIKPNVIVKVNDKELILNTDYTISYDNNINEGQGSVLVKGIGIYQGTVTKTFKIVKDDISSKAIKLSYTSTTYTGAKKCPTVSISGLIKDVDYTVSYGSNTNAGNGTVIIQGKGLYKGSITKTFTIAKASITKKSAKLSYTTATYSGKKRLPSASVSGLKYKRDFVISGGKTSIGKGYVYIKGTGNYTGTITKSFKIVPKKVSIKKPSSGKKKIAIKYYRTSGSCYYQVAYRKAGSSKWYYKNTKSSYKIVTKLKSKKYYYVKVRAYKSVGGVKYYGSWSNTRKVKVK